MEAWSRGGLVYRVRELTAHVCKGNYRARRTWSTSVSGRRRPFPLPIDRWISLVKSMITHPITYTCTTYSNVSNFVLKI
jgi:hypothetical protein